MPKRLLLVDDEKVFLKSLKEGLEPLSHIFETDICHSVDDAIKKVQLKRYDLIVTDIRMPGQSGIDFMLYLNKIRFNGRLMVMSAYNTQDSINQIHSYGVLDVISKPFNFSWFKDKIMEVFSQDDQEKEKLVTFESIDILSVMQIINLEARTSALEIGMPEGNGIIYFEDGELIHAQYGDLEGGPAVIEIMTNNNGNISIKHVRDKVHPTIHTPFHEYIIHVVKTIDEQKRDRKNSPAAGKNKINQTGDNEFSIRAGRQLELLHSVNGFLGAGVFSTQGNLIEGGPDIFGVSFREAGRTAAEILINASTQAKKSIYGNIDLLQLHTPLGIVFARLFKVTDQRYYIVLVIKSDGNVAMARMKMERVIRELNQPGA